MNYLDIKDYLPLSELEEKYKELFQSHPELALDSPKTLEQVETLTGTLENFQQLYLQDPSGFSPDDTLMENIFPLHCDTAVNRHLRYSPAFFHSHDFFEIICLLHGHCMNHISSHPVEMTPGDVCIMAPNTVHAISAFSDDSILMNLLVRQSTFESAFFGTLTNKDIISAFFSRALYASANDTYLFFPTADNPEIKTAFMSMFEEFQSNSRYSERMMNAMANSFFIKLLRMHEKDVIVPNPQNNSTDTNIILILNYLHMNYQTVTLKTLSAFFNYSERQMARILKDYTGQNFMALVQSIKLEKARELLANPALSIQKIVELTGYSNVSHFYNIFKEQYDMTPTEYRAEFYQR